MPNFNHRILKYTQISPWIISENDSTTTVQTELTATTSQKDKSEFNEVNKVHTVLQEH